MSDDQKTPPEAAEAETLEAETPEAEGQDDGNPVSESEIRIAELEGQVLGLKDQVLRAHAEMENIRKRAAKEAADARVYAVEKFARDLLSVSDNLLRALEALPEEERAALTEAGQNLLGGIEMTQKELHTVLARHGVTSVDAAPGDTFDPNCHEAVTQMPSEHPSGTIAQTFQSGWKIGERTLRAAMVAVSAGKPS